MFRRESFTHYVTTTDNYNDAQALLATPQNFFAGLRMYMPCAKFFPHGIFPVYGRYLQLMHTRVKLTFLGFSNNCF